MTDNLTTITVIPADVVFYGRPENAAKSLAGPLCLPPFSASSNRDISDINRVTKGSTLQSIS
jgi:hypothetical protein